jgi:EAL domain-containing protein (putative c-di-GMP-specific phosphodiesterase class I)
MASNTSATAKPHLLMPPPAALPPASRRVHVIEQRSDSPRTCTRAGAGRHPWLARLRRALADDLFTVRYQPIVSLQDGRTVHWEALVRLVDSDDGSLLAPDRFLPAAERYGLIGEIDRLVLDCALAALARGRSPDAADAGRPGVAVNMSAPSVTDPEMLGFVAESLERHGVDPAVLVLEVTETSSISDMARARGFCTGAQALGCAVALDDFGAGFGSLRYLRHLPFRYLKIDGCFIRGLLHSERDQLIVSTLVALAGAMGARTIAEYVGESATMSLLVELGVDYAQGYAIGRPGLAPRAGEGVRAARLLAPAASAAA